MKNSCYVVLWLRLKGHSKTSVSRVYHSTSHFS